MHIKAIESYTNQLIVMAHNLLYPWGLPQSGKRILEVEGETSAFTYTHEGHETHTDLLRKLLKQWGDKFSEHYLEGKLLDMLRRVMETRSTSTIQEDFQKLVTEYEEFATEYTVIIPLAGLRMEMEQLQMGKVILRNMTGETAARFSERCRAITMQTAHTTEQKHALFKQSEDYCLAKIKDKACAEVNVIAEAHRAEEIALEEARRVVDLLRFSILMLDKSENKKVVGLQGEVGEDPRVAFAMKSDDTGFHEHQSLVFHRFVLNEQVVNAMREIGVFVLSDLLQRPNVTDFETVIIRAVHWLASAQSQYENENALLNLVTCLETFLKPAKDDPITATIAEGVAILTATGLDERKRRKKLIKDFYSKRSTITHEGHGNILLSDLKQLADIARELTVQMIRRKDEFQNQQKLRDWIDDQKLGGCQQVVEPS